MLRMLILPGALALGFVPMPVAAHGGGLDASGCHTNRRTGDYHCHRGAAPTRRTEATPMGLMRRNSASFANCAAARAAGAAPVREGDPGYGVHLDRDRDGVGCER